jgi:branched-chain amino acid transport system permease protein
MSDDVSTAERRVPFAASLRSKHRLRPAELLPLVAVAIVPLLGSGYYPLATQIAITVIFGLSLDLLVGYAGIVTLGHGIFFGVGAYASGIASVHGWGDPVSGLFVGAAAAAVVGVVQGFVVLRTARFTLLMLTLCSVFLVSEVANKAGWLTGGADGLTGVTTGPLLGVWTFDLDGRTGYLFSATVFVLVWIGLRGLVHAPFGQAIMAIRDNPGRAEAIGMAVRPRLLIVYTVSAAIAGTAGALQAEIDQFAGLKNVGFEISATILVMLALGGTGRLYGAMAGPAVYLIAQDLLAKINPAMWQLWLGLLIVATVLFVPGGLSSLADVFRGRGKR